MKRTSKDFSPTSHGGSASPSHELRTERARTLLGNRKIPAFAECPAIAMAVTGREPSLEHFGQCVKWCMRNGAMDVLAKLQQEFPTFRKTLDLTPLSPENAIGLVDSLVSNGIRCGIELHLRDSAMSRQLALCLTSPQCAIFYLSLVFPATHPPGMAPFAPVLGNALRHCRSLEYLTLRGPESGTCTGDLEVLEQAISNPQLAVMKIYSRFSFRGDWLRLADGIEAALRQREGRPIKSRLAKFFAFALACAGTPGMAEEVQLGLRWIGRPSHLPPETGEFFYSCSEGYGAFAKIPEYRGYSIFSVRYEEKGMCCFAALLGIFSDLHSIHPDSLHALDWLIHEAATEREFFQIVNDEALSNGDALIPFVTAWNLLHPRAGWLVDRRPDSLRQLEVFGRNQFLHDIEVNCKTSDCNLPHVLEIVKSQKFINKFTVCFPSFSNLLKVISCDFFRTLKIEGPIHGGDDVENLAKVLDPVLRNGRLKRLVVSANIEFVDACGQIMADVGDACKLEKLELYTSSGDGYAPKWIWALLRSRSSLKVLMLSDDIVCRLDRNEFVNHALQSAGLERIVIWDEDTDSEFELANYFQNSPALVEHLQANKERRRQSSRETVVRTWARLQNAAPVELMWLIVDHLEANAVRQLASTCRGLWSARVASGAGQFVVDLIGTTAPGATQDLAWIAREVSLDSLSELAFEHLHDELIATALQAFDDQLPVIRDLPVLRLAREVAEIVSRIDGKEHCMAFHRVLQASAPDAQHFAGCVDWCAANSCMGVVVAIQRCWPNFSGPVGLSADEIGTLEAILHHGVQCEVVLELEGQDDVDELLPVLAGMSQRAGKGDMPLPVLDLNLLFDEDSPAPVELARALATAPLRGLILRGDAEVRVEEGFLAKLMSSPSLVHLTLAARFDQELESADVRAMVARATLRSLRVHSTASLLAAVCVGVVNAGEWGRIVDLELTLAQDVQEREFALSGWGPFLSLLDPSLRISTLALDARILEPGYERDEWVGRAQPNGSLREFISIVDGKRQEWPPIARITERNRSRQALEMERQIMATVASIESREAANDMAGLPLVEVRPRFLDSADESIDHVMEKARMDPRLLGVERLVAGVLDHGHGSLPETPHERLREELRRRISAFLHESRAGMLDG